MTETPLVVQLRDRLKDELLPKYDLIYVDRGDKLTDKQVDALVANDWETFYEALEPWESEARHEGATSVLKDLVDDVLRVMAREEGDLDTEALKAEFDGSTEEDEVREAILERESGDWLKDLANGCDKVLLRINCIDEDHSFAFREVQPAEVLEAVGFEQTPENLRIIEQMLPECSPEYSVLLGYWIVGADVTDLLNMGWEVDEVEITNPYLYLGNPFAGSGWIAEEPLQGKVRIKRSDLRTDRDAFGYSVNEVYGGLYASTFEAAITAVPKATTEEVTTP